MATQYLTERIAKTKELIEAWETASLAFADNGALQSYTLDTAQTRQTVTRGYNIDGVLDKLYNRLAMLEKRCNGRALIASPAW
jgi:hypothetical protein